MFLCIYLQSYGQKPDEYLPQLDKVITQAAICNAQEIVNVFLNELKCYHQPGHLCVEDVWRNVQCPLNVVCRRISHMEK